ncbi:MAG: hypothetical protein IJE04_01140 [Bacilli bacterium]|nr:hypothetical protein [Bacilli bacterium]
MALKKDFYTEIFEKEQKWIELINTKLLNAIYCKFSLQPFYISKKKELEQEYFLTHNEIMGNVVSTLDLLISQLEVLYEQFRTGYTADANSLIPLFLITKMSNSYKNENINEMSQLQIKKQKLEQEIRNAKQEVSFQEDYVYDDFPEEVRKVK